MCHKYKGAFASFLVGNWTASSINSFHTPAAIDNAVFITTDLVK